MTAADAAVCQCGHSEGVHFRGRCHGHPKDDVPCPCTAFVANGGRPEKPWVAPRNGGYSAPNYGPANPQPPKGPGAVATAAVPDREVDPLDASGSGEHVDVQHALGATEQLAALLGRHRHHPPMQTHGGYMENGCSCGVVLDRPDMAGDWAQAAIIHDTHLAAVIVAAGWRKA